VAFFCGKLEVPEVIDSTSACVWLQVLEMEKIILKHITESSDLFS